jgi:hypothetical protein
LPDRVCWFELCQEHRPHFMASPTHYAEHQRKPKRVGFLCVAQDTQLWRWNTFLMWSLQNPRTQLYSPFPGLVSGGHFNNASSISVAFDTKDGMPPATSEKLGQLVQICIAPYTNPTVRRALLQGNELSKLLQSDWGGEVRFLLALLGLFNARNVMEVEPVDKSKHNKSRRRDGKPPLCNHTILKIRAAHRRSLIGTRGKGTAGDIREHFVVGHWKARRTGLFWWNPFWRGNPEHGRISHDYELTT